MYSYILFLLIFFFFFSAEILYRKGVDAFWTRKIVHIGVGTIISIFPYFLTFKTTMFLGVITTIFIIFLRNNNLLKSVFNIERKSVGARIFIPSLMLLAFLSWENPFLFTMVTLILAWADGLAGVIGKKFGNKKIYGEKTFFGSFVFFNISLFIMTIFLFNILVFWKILIISFVITIIELFFSRGWDNLFIPLGLLSMIYFSLW